MDTLRDFLSSLYLQMAPYVPRLLGAVALLVGTWIAAKVVRAVVVRFGSAVGIDRRMQSEGLTAKLAAAASMALWLLALPTVLASVGMESLVAPINAMMTKLFAFLPNLLGAAIVFGIGLILAGIVRNLVAGSMSAAGSEALAARLGLTEALGTGGLAGLAGLLVFGLIMLPVVAASLEPLQMESVTQPVGRLIDTVMTLIPRLLAAAVVVAIAAVLGRVLAGIVAGVLAGLGFDRAPAALGLPPMGGAGRRSASELAGQVTMLAMVFIAITQACEMIGFSVLTESVTQLGAALVRIGTGLALLGLGLWLARLAAEAVAASGVAHALALGRVARGGVLFFATALALRQMGLPAEIISMAFGAAVFAVAVAFALAIGLGGRRVAGQLLQRAAGAWLPEAPGERPAVGGPSDRTPA